MKRNNYSLRNMLRGFTLIEFLVASILTMIVITAAGSTYLITRKMNANTQQRLDVQQNLRNAAALITRDARNAGSFGCFSTSGSLKQSAAAKIQFTGRGIGLDKDQDDGFGVRWVKTGTLTGLDTTGIVDPSNALVFVYGKGSAGTITDIENQIPKSLEIVDVSNDPDLKETFTKGGDIVISNCGSAYSAKPTGFSGNKLAFAKEITAKGINTKPATSKLSETSKAEITVSKLYASAYLVGKVNSVSSLLRYDLDASGSWQGPQLLAQNVESITPTFGYVDETKCEEGKHDETFDFSSSLNKRKLPAIVQLNVKFKYDKGGDEVDYLINATVRSGNVCATLRNKEKN